MSSVRPRCPISCNCLCHDTGGFHGGMHGTNGRCPTKDGVELTMIEQSGATE